MSTSPRWFRPAFRLALSLLLPLLAGLVGGLATVNGVVEWYPTLTKPPFNPPAWVFGPVWTTLYVLMGVAAFLVWQKGLSTPGVARALGVYGIHLVLNALWSVVFFGMRAPGWAFLEILLLWAALLATMVLFFRHSRAAGWLLAPYLAWVTFAGVLNFAIWLLNR